MQRLEATVVALGQGESRLGLGQGARGLRELPLAGRGLDLGAAAGRWLIREPASTQIATTGPITRLDTKASRPGCTMPRTSIGRREVTRSTVVVRTVTGSKDDGASSASW